MAQRDIARRLVDRHGSTFAERAEVQGAWPELAPFVDDIAAKGARRLGLSPSPGRLATLPRLAGAGAVGAHGEDGRRHTEG